MTREKKLKIDWDIKYKVNEYSNYVSKLSAYKNRLEDVKSEFTGFSMLEALIREVSDELSFVTKPDFKEKNDLFVYFFSPVEGAGNLSDNELGIVDYDSYPKTDDDGTTIMHYANGISKLLPEIIKKLREGKL